MSSLAEGAMAMAMERLLARKNYFVQTPHGLKINQNGSYYVFVRYQVNSKVADIMSSPAITLTPEKTVKDAAALMLRMKIHRIPILNQQKQVIGMVTRSDIFEALQDQSSA